jgi:hypothetical protein
MLSAYEGRMIVPIAHRPLLLRATQVAALLALGIGLSGCAAMDDPMSSAFADPAKYDLYDCKQLETERKTLATRAAELQSLMARADTGVGGPVVAEFAYRSDLLAVRGKTKLADEAWRRNKCHETPAATSTPAVSPATTAPPATRKGSPSQAGSAAF